MFRQFFQVIVAFGCCFLFIKWVPFATPFSITDLFVYFVLDPLEFFAAVLAFFTGFICQAEIIKNGFINGLILLKEKKIDGFVLFIGFLNLIGFLIVLYYGMWQTILFFSFSILYAIICLKDN